MPLTHVCVWDSEIGYRRITVEEARKMHPFGVPASYGCFVCELCAQNVLLTAPGVNIQHFRHDPSSPNKECDERQAYFDPTYGRTIRGLNSHVIPLRLVVKGSTFSLELGFFYPPEKKAHCDRIRIANDAHQLFEYSFERIEKFGTTYLSVGSIPSRVYGIDYVNSNDTLQKYWSNKITGINSSGSFFNAQTGHILLPGAKAYSDNSYYLLQRHQLFVYNSDLEVTQISQVQSNGSTTWYLYKIRVKHFTARAAKFFLGYSIFLTEKPTKFYPLWPAYTTDPHFIYHNSANFYFYLCGDDAELKSFPASSNVLDTHDGKLYKLYTREREQLISIGKSGALGFSYLIKQPLNKKVSKPKFSIKDSAGTELTEDSYTKLPKSKLILVSCQYDGKAVVRRKQKIEHIYKLSSEQDLLIDGLAFDTEICFYHGCDCVRTLQFQKEEPLHSTLDFDNELVTKLRNCSGPMIAVTHSIGSVGGKLSAYPETKRWLLKAIRKGKMPRSAYLLLQKLEFRNELNTPNRNRM